MLHEVSPAPVTNDHAREHEGVCSTSYGRRDGCARDVESRLASQPGGERADVGSAAVRVSEARYATAEEAFEGDLRAGDLAALDVRPLGAEQEVLLAVRPDLDESVARQRSELSSVEDAAVWSPSGRNTCPGRERSEHRVAYIAVERPQQRMQVEVTSVSQARHGPVGHVPQWSCHRRVDGPLAVAVANVELEYAWELACAEQAALEYVRGKLAAAAHEAGRHEHRYRRLVLLEHGFRVRKVVDIPVVEGQDDGAVR